MSFLSGSGISGLVRVAMVAATLAAGVAASGSAFAQRGQGPFGGGGARNAEPQQPRRVFGGQAVRGGGQAFQGGGFRSAVAPQFRGGGQAFVGGRSLGGGQAAFGGQRNYRPAIAAPRPVYQTGYRWTPRVRQVVVPYTIYEPYPVYDPYPVYRTVVHYGPRCVIKKRWVMTKRGWKKLPRKICYRR